MPINQFLAGSLTSALLANPANLPPPAPLVTLSDRFGWIDASRSAPPPRHVAQPSRAEGKRPGAWSNQLAANARSISALEAGWDGPGSVAISPEILARAVFYVDSALKDVASDLIAPRLVPGGDGSLQIEWHTRRGELELDLDTDGAMSIWIRDHASGAEFDGGGEEAFALFYRWAPWIASRLHDVPHAPVQAHMALFEIAA